MNYSKVTSNIEYIPEFISDQTPHPPPSTGRPENSTKVPYTIFEKFAYGSLATLGIAIGSILTVAGSGTGMFVAYRLYFETGVGLKIFRILKKIFFPIGSGFAATAAFFATDVGGFGMVYARILAKISAACFAIPFFPIGFGATGGGYAGVRLTQVSYNFFWEVLK